MDIRQTPEELFKCILPIGYIEDQRIVITGTAFYIKSPEDEVVRIITARHCIIPSEDKTDAEKEIILKSAFSFRYKYGDQNMLHQIDRRFFNKLNIKFHYNYENDFLICANYVNDSTKEGGEIDHSFVEGIYLVDGLDIGEEVFLYGYPNGDVIAVHDPNNEFPIMLKGKILSINDDEIKISYKGDYKGEYQTDVDKIQGSSGGPVFIMREDELFLIGIIKRSTIPITIKKNQNSVPEYTADLHQADFKIVPINLVVNELNHQDARATSNIKLSKLNFERTN